MENTGYRRATRISELSNRWGGRIETVRMRKDKEFKAEFGSMRYEEKGQKLLRAFSLVNDRDDHKNIHICGEAYSDYQGLVEGALRSARVVLDWIEAQQERENVPTGKYSRSLSDSPAVPTSKLEA